MAVSVRIPLRNGETQMYELGEPGSFDKPDGSLTARRAFAAAHVVADPLAENTSVSGAHLDWEATLAFRRHLWSWGLSVAEAMDTAQRGMGLDWPVTKELIKRSLAEARSVGGDIACGANTDQNPDADLDLGGVVDAYLEQLELIEGEGGQAVIMASRHLAAIARGPEDYQDVYGRILEQVQRPVIVHWLGEMFDPSLRGYWGSTDLDQAQEHFLGLLADHADQIDGVKISLLDKDRELYLRKSLPEGVRMYTGDDFNYPELILGDGTHHSDTFLGAFDLIAPAASSAIQALGDDDISRFEAILNPTVPLSRHVFGEPTFYYKTGVVFMAYLNGHQDHFRMVNGLESSRSVVNLSEQFVLADRAGLLDDPGLAARRMAALLELAGLSQD